jgi:hypothetical protein
MDVFADAAAGTPWKKFAEICDARQKTPPWEVRANANEIAKSILIHPYPSLSILIQPNPKVESRKLLMTTDRGGIGRFLDWSHVAQRRVRGPGLQILGAALFMIALSPFLRCAVRLVVPSFAHERNHLSPQPPRNHGRLALPAALH